MRMLIIAVAVLVGGCAPKIDSATDTPSPAATAVRAELIGAGDLEIPSVVIDSRGFKQAWGFSQTSVELADYVNELEAAAARIDVLPNVAPHWSRLSRQLRNEARQKLLTLIKLQNSSQSGGVSQAHGMLIPVAAGETFKSVYESEFRKQRAIEFEKNVRNVPLPVLYDALVEGIKDGSLREELPKVGVKPDQIPMRLVRKASGARDDARCALDPNEANTKEPNKLEMLLAYLGTDCYARKMLYGAVKKLLVGAKKTPAVQEVLAKKFDEIFPERFKQAFQGGFSEALLTAHVSLQKKIDASQKQDLFEGFSFLEPYWQAPSLESRQVGLQRMGLDELGSRDALINMQQLGLTLGAQTAVAADLLDTQDRSARLHGLIAAYGAMEKMLFLLGRPAAVFKKGLVQIKPLDRASARRGLAPEVERESRGGLAYNLATQKLEAWDLDADLKSAVSGKIFPQWALVDHEGKAAELPRSHSGTIGQESDLGTLVSLIDGALTFLELSRSPRTIGMKFGDAAKVIDPADRSVLFAAELRELPLGVIAISMKTILDYHLVALDAEGRPLPAIDSPELAGLTLRERSGEVAVLDAAAASRALLVMTRVARALGPEGALADRAELDGARKQLAMALPLAALNLGRQLQDADGGFASRLDLGTGARLSGKRTLGVQALTLAAHLEIYRLYGTPALLKRAMRLLAFMKSPAMWSASARFFRSDEGATQSQFRAQDLLRLMNVCLGLGSATGVNEMHTQSLALAERVRELLEEASFGKELETLGLVTP